MQRDRKKKEKNRIMESNKMKFLWIAAYIVCALISCWATAESLHMLLDSWPGIFCWAVSAVFFLVASLGTKLIVDSLTVDSMESRGMALIGGIVLTLVFWLLCSMPTNTHTFIYRDRVKDELSADIATTQTYLQQIMNNNKAEDEKNKNVKAMENEVKILLGELEAEIKNEVNPGFGDASREILRKIAAAVDVPKIEPLSLGGGANTTANRNKLCDAYRSKVYTLMETKAETIRSSVDNNATAVSEAETAYKCLVATEDSIKSGAMDIYDATGVREVCTNIMKGYNVINNYHTMVDFKTAEDEATYTAQPLVTKASDLLSVMTVWGKLLGGEYGGGYVYWIIIGVLIDVAAFVAFDLAFKKEDI